ncbi:hypothetical protein [Paragemmobacter straminiformis]|uniref:Uncharacterized protein n=1 Tax=Paragemmobacter straminiformis TaxID=2045119 RepID=A0A842IBK7_9RHOB|nr:hypothetical protein [Gemmobacter straminiformis]MBC2836793.1 hypothetical protein [Gemmobacter straminiformis]
MPAGPWRSAGYATGQLSFSAEKLTGWSVAMDAAGTPDVYWQTKFDDFAFLACVGGMGVLTAALPGRGLGAPAGF